MCSVRSSSHAKFSLKCSNIYGVFLTKTLFHKTFMLEHYLRTKKNNVGNEFLMRNILRKVVLHIVFCRKEGINYKMAKAAIFDLCMNKERNLKIKQEASWPQ